MRLKLESDFSGVTQGFDLMIDGLKDLKPILKRFGAVVRKEVQAIFESEGPGWKPREASTDPARTSLSDATKDRIRRRAEFRLSTKLRKDYRRASERFLKGRGKRSTVLLRKHVMEEFDRITLEGGSFDQTSLDPKQAKSLKGRIDRSLNKAEAESGRILRRIASSIVVEVEKASLIIRSKIPWAGIHNLGGTAGHGAQIPARTFLEWTSARVQKLADIAKAYMMEKWAKAQKKK